MLVLVFSLLLACSLSLNFPYSFIWANLFFCLGIITRTKIEFQLQKNKAKKTDPYRHKQNGFFFGISSNQHLYRLKIWNEGSHLLKNWKLFIRHNFFWFLFDSIAQYKLCQSNKNKFTFTSKKQGNITQERDETKCRKNNALSHTDTQ